MEPFSPFKPIVYVITLSELLLETKSTSSSVEENALLFEDGTQILLEDNTALLLE